MRSGHACARTQRRQASDIDNLRLRLRPALALAAYHYKGQPVTRFRPIILAGLVAALLHAPLQAQHGLADGGPFDPAVPTPTSVLGYELGERFTPHHLIVRYAEAVATASPRVRLDTVAHSHEGREVLLVTITSEANQARLEEIRRAARTLADPRTASAAELERLVAATPAIVWLGYTVHGNEASGVEAALAVMYELAAAGDPETRMILDSVVVLIDPVQNPDGHERHVQQVLWDRGRFPDPNPAAMEHGQAWHGSRTNHYLFDLNRDWLVHAHPETRGRMAVFTSWFPHVAVDLHEMGHNTTYFFAPPMPPVHQNVHPLIWKGWERFSRGNVEAFGAEGLGFYTREDFDEFFPGYGPSWPIMSGAIGMTYEQASSRGGAIERDDGTVLTLRESTRGHYVASRATLRTAATHRTERVADYLAFRQASIRDNARSALRTVAFADDGQGRATALVHVLQRHGIEVGRLNRPTDVRATAYGEDRTASVRLPAGTYVVDLAQPQGVLARTLLEPEAALDPAFVAEELERRETGERNRFYDMTAWALPYLFRVDAWWTGQAVGPAGPVLPGDGGGTTVAGGAGDASLPDRARYAYAFEPGHEASLRLLAALLADEVRVRHASHPFRADGTEFPLGAFVVIVNRNEADVHDRVRARTAETGARVVALHNARVEEGPDLGSSSVRPIPASRVGLVGGDGISATSFGAAWHAFDELFRFPVTRVGLAGLTQALDGFDVLVIPSAFNLGSRLGETGAEALTRWVRQGGTLITLDGATAWLASDEGPARLRVRDSEPAEDGRAPLPAAVPGAILRAEAHAGSPLLAGVAGTELPVVVFGTTIYEAPVGVRPGEVVLRLAPEDRLRLAGYLWPELPPRLAGAPYVWTERLGSGRVIAFAGDPNFRGITRGLLPLFANAVFLGPTM
jgi:hypothetical protein